MNRYNILFSVVMVIGELLKPSSAHSQDIYDPETEYIRVRKIAFEGELITAYSAARRLVNMYPSYGDARILLGRIMGWKKDYANAIAVIDTLLITEPDNSDALSAKSDILLWAKESTPVSTDIRTGYSFDGFTEPYSRFWQIFKAGAGHRFTWGPAAAAFNIGNLVTRGTSPVSAAEFQIEAEAYPKLSDKNYAYLAYAYSPGMYFPGHRAAIEVWQILPAGWAVSAGLNYYYFDRSIFIASAAGEKYLGRYWLSLKGYVYFKDDGPTTSVYFNARRYRNDNDYLQITISTGTAPDEPFDIQADLMRLSAHSIRLAYYVSITHKLAIRLGTGYSYEEYAEGFWRNRFEGGLNLIYAIKMK